MEDKITVALECGFEFEVDTDALDDMEVYQELRILQKGEGLDKTDALYRIFERTAGEDQIKAFKEYLTARDGKVKRSLYDNAAGEVFKALADNKKK
jgi:hypothetical protein